MAINLFENCIDYTVAGIKNLKLMAKLEDGSAISFPIDVVLKSGDEATIVGSITGSSQLIAIGNQTMQYVEPYVDNSTFREEQTEDRRGKYFTITIEFQFPKVSLYTNNQIKDFLFVNDGQFAIANAVALFTDNNDNQWLTGYDLPVVVEALDDTTGGDDNFYSMQLVARTYNRMRRFEEV